MKGKKTWRCLFCVVFFMWWAQLASAQSATTTVHSAKDGYWKTASTWQENRVPTVDDVVEVAHTVRLRGTSVTVKGLVITDTGVVRGRNTYYRGNIKATEYFSSRGSIGKDMNNVQLGGYIASLGQLHISTLRLLAGPIHIEPMVPVHVELDGDISIENDIAFLGDFGSKGHAIYAYKEPSIYVESIKTRMTIVGSSSVVVGQHGDQDIYVANIDALESSIELSAETIDLKGSINALDTLVRGRVTSTKPGSSITGDVTIASTGQLRGEAVWVRHAFGFGGSLVNYGVLGPDIDPDIHGDFHQLGQYKAGVVRLYAAGDKQIVGEIPTNIELYADQVWTTSPVVFGIKSRGHVLTLPEGVQLSVTNVSNAITIEGGGSLEIIDPEHNEGYSPNVQRINAPDISLVFDASAARLHRDISARTVEFRNSAQVSDDLTISADKVSFNQGSLRGRGSSRSYNVIIDSPELVGSGHLGPYTTFRIYTNIPQGFTAGWNTGVYLEHKGANWQGTYRLAGALYDFLANPLSVISDAPKPNLRDALNSGTPYYYSYETNRGWSDVLTLNTNKNHLDPVSDIGDRNFYHIAFTPNQRKNSPFTLTVTTPNNPEYDGQVRLLARMGQIYPHRIDIQDGVWQGEIELFDSVIGQQITVQGVGGDMGRSGRSNYFSVFDTRESRGYIQGVVREGNGERSGVGQVLLTNLSTLEQYSVLVDTQGRYSTDLSAGQYRVETGHSLVQTVQVREGETVVYDIVRNRLCAESDKVPVLLVPGMMGSDRVGSRQVFPELTRHTSSWDEQALEIHDPGGVTGFGLLTDELEEAGYEYGCTVFHVPYDWSLSVDDAARQYLAPWIDHAKRAASSSQVDIVAHSMGGLVARAYVQGDDYSDDVRTIAMVGTPNLGSAKSYFAWEGGDPMQADLLDQSIISGLVGAANYQSNTININYKIKTGNNTNLCRYGLPSLINLFRANDDVIACDRVLVRDFLHSYAPSAGELYPVYDFLFDTDGDVVIPEYHNTLLHNLNTGQGGYMPLDERAVRVGLFVGRVHDELGEVEKQTVDNIVVDPGHTVEDTYNDGQIVYLTYWQGDGTVLEESVKGIEYDYVEYFNRPHESILVSADTSIINYLQNQ